MKPQSHGPSRPSWGRADAQEGLAYRCRQIARQVGASGTAVRGCPVYLRSLVTLGREPAMMTRLILGNVCHMHRCLTVLHMAATGSFSFQERSVSLPISRKVWRRGNVLPVLGKVLIRDKPGPVVEEAWGGGGPDSGSEGGACDVPRGFLSQHFVALDTSTTPSTKEKTGPRASALAS